jgi:chromosome segregation ATPase
MAGEIYKAGKTLAELRGDIETATHELGPLREEATTLTSSNEVLRREGSTLAGQNRSVILQIGKNEEILAETTKKADAAEKRRVREEGLAAEAVRTRDAATTERTRVLEETDGHKKEARRAEKEAEKKRLELAEVDTLLTARKTELGTVREDLRKENSLLAKTRKVREDIEGAIETALTRFQLFERRIGKLTAKHGYAVGYPSPIKIKEKFEKEKLVGKK